MVIDKIKDIKFSRPIVFEVEKGKNLITAYNEEFNISGVGKDEKELLEDLYIEIIDTIDLLLDPSMNFSPTSEKYIKKFLDTFKYTKEVNK